MAVLGSFFAATIQKYVDQRYGYGFCDRCGGSCREFDCSGIQCKGCNETGLTRNLCTTSFVLAQQCTALGLEMSWDEAIADSGPDAFWAFHGADHGRVDDGSRPNGASGHVVLVVRVRNPDGTTKGWYTIEAMGHAYGCVNGQFLGRSPGWTGLYRIPGVVDASHLPPADWETLKKLDDWRKSCYARPIKAGRGGERSPRVRLLNDLLRQKHFLPRWLPIGNAAGWWTRNGIYKLKLAHPEIFDDTDGTSFGGPAADALLKP